MIIMISVAAVYTFFIITISPPAQAGFWDDLVNVVEAIVDPTTVPRTVVQIGEDIFIRPELPKFVDNTYVHEWGREAWVFAEPHPGTVPLYEYKRSHSAPGIFPFCYARGGGRDLTVPRSEDFIYTTTLDNDRLKRAYYNLVTIAAYVYPDNPSPPHGTVPLYRYVMGGACADHFYSISSTSPPGYTPEHHEGNVFPKYTPGTFPLLQYLIEEKWHYYSVHPEEINQFAEEEKVG